MPNFSSILKIEISRLARKEIRQEIEPLKRSLVNARSEIAVLKKKMRTLEQELKVSRKAATTPLFAEREGGSAPKFRFRAATMKAHRAKLGLSAKDYGLLIGASLLSVYKWEDGKVAPREKMLSSIASVLRMGKREALRKLAELQGT